MYLFFSFFFTYFIRIPLVLWPLCDRKPCTFSWYIYDEVVITVFISLHVLFLFSLYAHASYIFVCNLLFLFHTKMPWWVLFKMFQKYRLSKSSLPSTLFLQSFSKFCVKINFIVFNKWVWVKSDLWLLSYDHLIVVVLFRIAKEGDCGHMWFMLGTYVIMYWLILSQNALVFG